ncbi:MAG TPA: type I restriction enzyme HsdR N-terminal domain-containing protein [Chitinophagaceae bacterium]|nr:type I restriction enzyme HsdR N-terminal domain-containing protein [Chitinophagaceae bacterium]
MIKINYPTYQFKFNQKNGKEFIFDAFRKLWVRLTPEEWVRQNFLQYLVQEKKYPIACIAVEKEVMVNGIKKRCDIIVFKNYTPYMIVECKEMNVALTEKTIQQILTYNQSLSVNILVITNGNNTFALETTTKKSLNSIPAFSETIINDF